MLKKIAYYFVCSFVVLGFVACNQQSQNNIEQTVTPEVKPAPTKQGKKKTEQKKKKQKQKRKQAPVAPVKEQTIAVQETAPVAEPAPGSAEITPPAAEPTTPAPARLRPLGKRVSSVPMKGKYVALTFDDGPHSSLTPKALSILNRHGAKGTFFMLGQNAARNRSIVRQAASQGHEVGVHTWSHIKMNSSSRAKVDSEVSRTQNLLAECTGTRPRVMRPPYGATNKTLVDHMYKRYGMASIMWDVDTYDWRKPGVSTVVNRAVNNARPGSIILVHDIHASTLDALERIVTGLQARGFKLVTVSELMLIGKREAAQPAEAPEEAPAAVETPAAETPAEDSAPQQAPQPEPAPEATVLEQHVPAVPAPEAAPAAAEIHAAEQMLEQTTQSEL